MTKVYIKLIAMSLALILSVSVVIMSSYAWLVLSGNPAATGIQVAIGGGNTILAAPNIKFTDDNGTIYNIPGKFSDRMNFGQQEQYAYLQEVGNLTPVSTSNGLDWFLPTYYSGNDEQVQQGRVPSGALRDISEFRTDSTLGNANLQKGDPNIDDGNYVYLDFWVVSPGGDYFLRVSTGDGNENGGSFVIDLLETDDSNDGNSLTLPEGSAAAAVRVGFLANDVQLTNKTMEYYSESKDFDSRFTALRGDYSEPGTGMDNGLDRFTIYEPNGDYHPAHSTLEGSFVDTKSLELVDDQVREQQKSDSDLHLTVQRKSSWSMADNGVETALEQVYTTAQMARLGEKLTQQDGADLLYGKYLQGQIAPYVTKGSFVKSTGNLISVLNTSNGAVTADELISKTHGTADTVYGGATDDVYIIRLERNVPQRIRMFIWLEGQDIDCVDNISSARFAVNIELAGGDQ